MASTTGGAGGGGQNPGASCEFCDGIHDPTHCPLFKHHDLRIFGFQKIRFTHVVSMAKELLLQQKVLKPQLEYLVYRDHKIGELRTIRDKLEADRELLRAYLRAAKNLRDCLNIRGNATMLYNVGAPSVNLAARSVVNPNIPNPSSNADEQLQAEEQSTAEATDGEMETENFDP